MVKVRKLKKNDKLVDMSLLLEKGEEYIDWNQSDLVKSIVDEISISEQKAEKIAENVKECIVKLCGKMQWDSVDSSFIREFVNNELLKYKTTKSKANKYGLKGLSSSEIMTIMTAAGNGENSNIRGNNPEAINFNIAEIVQKQFALDSVFSEEVKDAHYSGGIHLHDLGSPARFYAFSKHTQLPIEMDIKNGNLYHNMSLFDIWENLKDVKENKINETQYEKNVENKNIYVFDNGKKVKLIRIIMSKETKKMISFNVVIDDESKEVCVTANHGCVIFRDGEYIIIRADEVLITDKFISVA
jgi:hypothetical protein